MGWSTYPSLAAAKASMLRGVTVLRKSGSWVVYRTDGERGQVGMVQFLSRRDGDQTAVKAVGVESGPGAVPPEPLFRYWVALADSEGHEPGQYEADWRTSCEQRYAHARDIGTLSAGMTVRFADPLTYCDGTCEDTFILVDTRRRIARRASDKALVRLPIRFTDRVSAVLTD